MRRRNEIRKGILLIAALMLMLAVACSNVNTVEFNEEFTTYVKEGQYSNALKIYEETTEGLSEKKKAKFNDDLSIELISYFEEYSKDVKSDYKENNQLLELIEFARSLNLNSNQLESALNGYEQNAREIIIEIEEKERIEEEARLAQLEKERKEREKEEEEEWKRIEKINEKLFTTGISVNISRAVWSLITGKDFYGESYNRHIGDEGEVLYFYRATYNNHQVQIAVEPVRNEIYMIEITSEKKNINEADWIEEYIKIVTGTMLEIGGRLSDDEEKFITELVKEAYLNTQLKREPTSKELNNNNFLILSSSDETVSTIIASIEQEDKNR